MASVCGFYIHKPIPLYTAAKQYVTSFITSHGGTDRVHSAVVGLVRSFGTILTEEGITLNAVCPNKIRTNIGTADGYEKAEKAGCLVPMEHLLQAFEMLLNQGKYKDLSGECLEVAPKIGVRKVNFVPFVNDESRISAEITYERSHYLHEVVNE